MSEKLQRTAQQLHERMINRYGDNIHLHKHNKYHLQYRKHYRTYPITSKETQPIANDRES